MEKLTGIENEKFKINGSQKHMKFNAIDSVFDMLKGFDNIVEVRKIYSIDEFNIFYILKDEPEMVRGLLVKNLTPHYKQYRLNDLFKYKENTSIIAYNGIDKIGLFYKHVDLNIKSVYVSEKKKYCDKYSKMLFHYDEFIFQLKKLAAYCPIINNEYYQQLKFNHKIKMKNIGNNAHNTGCSAEFSMIKILETLDSVVKIKKDYYNSKFDIYFYLKDGIKRGLQVKHLSRRSDLSNKYALSHIDSYTIGTLIVGLNEQYGVGLAYLYSDVYNDKYGHASIMKNPKGKYSKLLLNWPDFILHLEIMLKSATIITPEIFRLSMTPESYKEYLSIKRFKLFCMKYELDVKHYGSSCATDLMIGNVKIQMKYIEKPFKPNESYMVSFARHNREPYKKGDNDFYIMEIGSYHGMFLILHESILIDKQYIDTETVIGRHILHFFPYDYVKNNPTRKGNWTCEPKYWYSTENGHLMDMLL